MRWFGRLAAAAMVGGVVLLSGCGTTTVSQADIEQEVGDQLGQQTGLTPESVDCPDDLEAEVDNTMRCILTAPDGSSIGVTVLVDEVDGSDVSLSFEVDEAPIS